MPAIPMLLLSVVSHIRNGLRATTYEDMDRMVHGWDPSGDFHWDCPHGGSAIELDFSPRERQRLKVFKRLVF